MKVFWKAKNSSQSTQRPESHSWIDSALDCVLLENEVAFQQ